MGNKNNTVKHAVKNTKSYAKASETTRRRALFAPKHRAASHATAILQLFRYTVMYMVIEEALAQNQYLIYFFIARFAAGKRTKARIILNHEVSVLRRKMGVPASKPCLLVFSDSRRWPLD